MSYASYVFAAYAVFIALIAWDFIAPWWQVRQALRTAALRARREAARGTAPASTQSKPAPSARDPDQIA